MNTEKLSWNVEKDGADIEITATIPWSDVESHRKGVIDHFRKNLDLKGFRKGNAPDDAVKKEVGSDRILHEMAERALQNAYPKIVSEEKLTTIGRPHISITKLAESNPLEFKAETALMPEVDLPDYKSIAEKIMAEEIEAEITDKDVEGAVNQIRTQWAKSEKLKKTQGEGEDVDPSSITVTPEELPELTDEFVNELGNFENVEDFKSKLKENLGEEKRMKETEKKRAELLDAIREEAEMNIPSIVIESELEKMMQEFQGNVERAGFKLEEYLEQTEKSMDDLRNEWRADARKRAETQLVLNKIAMEENIKPDEKRVQEEVGRIMKMYDDANEERARIYVKSILTNEAVLKWLEGGEKEMTSEK
ncbi:MAG: trigger factor [Candidatus Paceibacterota bacterium]